MKKILLLAAFFLASFVGYSWALDDIIGEVGSVSDYSGFSISTYNVRFSSGNVYLQGAHVCSGVIFSSGSTIDYVVFKEIDESTGTALYTSTSAATEVFRVYTDTSANNNFGASGTIVTFPKTIAFPRGPIWNMSTWVYNSVNVLCQKQKH